MSIRRILAIWLLLAVAMSANGVFRELVLKPTLGATPADVVSALLGVAIILSITRWLLRSPSNAPTGLLVRASALMVGLTIAFEFLVGRYVDRKTWSELVADYAIWRGRLWPIVLLSLALAPFLWGRWISRRQ